MFLKPNSFDFHDISHMKVGIIAFSTAQHVNIYYHNFIPLPAISGIA